MAAQLWWMDSLNRAPKPKPKAVPKPKGYDSGGVAMADPNSQQGATWGLNTFRANAPYSTFRSTSPSAAGTLAQGNSQAAGGAGPASGTIGQMSALSQSLEAAANGQGPNPALEQLRQTTSSNINNAAGMAASARGVNPALAARMAVDTAGSENQAAAGQAATLSAEQQIAARQQLGQNLQGTVGAQLGQQAAGTSLLGTAGGLDLSSQGLNQQTGAQNAALNLGAQQINAGVSSQNASQWGQLIGGALNGAGGALSIPGGGGGGASSVADVAAPVLMGSGGGEVPSQADRGPLYSYLDGLHGSSQGGMSSGGQASSPPPGVGQALEQGSQDAYYKVEGQHLAGSMYANGGSIHAGGKVPVVLSPGEKVLLPGTSPSGAAARAGSAPRVPGKAQVQGNSPKNDTVHAKLTPGSIVLPRTVVNAANPAKAASSFVASLVKRGGRGHAMGGQVSGPGPDPAEVMDLSGGGYVRGGEAQARKGDSPKPASRATARGVGRQESRRRMSTSKERKYKEAE